MLRADRSHGLQVLLWERRREPFAGLWALPGGFLSVGESLETSVRRHLLEKVGIDSVGHLEQLETRSEPLRDPRGWVITTAFLALLSGEHDPDTPPDTAWHAVSQMPELAFDHAELVGLAAERLRGKLSYSNIAFALAPPEFTVSELSAIYRAVLGYEVSPTNLQRVLERGGLIAQSGKRRQPGSHGGRPAVLYRFTEHELTISKPLAAFRPRPVRKRGVIRT